MNTLTKHRGSVLWMAASGASLLTSYKLIRSVADSLFLAEFGSSKIPYLMTLVPIFVVLAMLGFSYLLKKFGPQNALRFSFAISGALFLFLYLLLIYQVPYVTAPLYLLKEIYVVILVAQHWSFINSIVTTKESKILSGPAIGISSLGAWLGGVAFQNMPEKIGSVHMIPIVVGFLALCLLFIQISFKSAPKLEDPIAHPEKLSEHFAIRQFFTEKTVLYLALLVAIAQTMSILFELSFLEVLQLAIPNKDTRSSYLVRMWNYMDFSTFAVTFLVTPLLLTKLPMKFTQLMIPTIHLGSAFLLWTHPTLATASLVFIGYKIIDYSIFSAAKETFYVPLSFASRYRAKQLIDAVVYRSSKGVVSGFISIVQSGIVTFSPIKIFPIICGGVSVVWMAIARKLIQQQQVKN